MRNGWTTVRGSGKGRGKGKILLNRYNYKSFQARTAKYNDYRNVVYIDNNSRKSLFADTVSVSYNSFPDTGPVKLHFI
jgi:hypothetical protein